MHVPIRNIYLPKTCTRIIITPCKAEVPNYWVLGPFGFTEPGMWDEGLGVDQEIGVRD